MSYKPVGFCDIKIDSDSDNLLVGTGKPSSLTPYTFVVVVLVVVVLLAQNFV